MKFYTITVAGVTRHLPICKLNDKIDIAGFVMLGDVEMTRACAKALVPMVPEHDIIVTAEAKGIPISQALCEEIGDPFFVCCRKGLKLYMQNPTGISVKSITTEGEQMMWIDECDVERIRGKKVLIVDDVVSTGESLSSIEKLITQIGGTICGKLCVLAEGEAAERTDIKFLEKLPLFLK